MRVIVGLQVLCFLTNWIEGYILQVNPALCITEEFKTGMPLWKDKFLIIQPILGRKQS